MWVQDDDAVCLPHLIIASISHVGISDASPAFTQPSELAMFITLHFTKSSIKRKTEIKLTANVEGRGEWGSEGEFGVS